MMVLISCIICGILMAIFLFICYKWKRLKPYNQIPLKIKTWDGLDSPFHPSVIYFHNGWNGWKYWMVETPFSPKCKPYVDRNECPSLHTSNDGVSWSEPTGLINPLVNLDWKGERNLDYYSDPHLVMVGNKMECWYRLTQRHGDINNRSKVSLRRIYTYNGVDWSAEEIIANLWTGEDDIGIGRMVVSPALIYSAQEGYTMWYVNSETKYGERKIVVSYSRDGYLWSNAIMCILEGCAINPWHIDVMQDTDGSYLLTVYDENNLTLWSSIDGITWRYISEMLSPSRALGSFYRVGLYRSCVVHDSSKYNLYFSAYDYDNTYIGLSTFNKPGEKIKLVSSHNNHTFKEFIGYCIQQEYHHVNFMITNLIKKLK